MRAEIDLLPIRQGMAREMDDPVHFAMRWGVAAHSIDELARETTLQCEALLAGSGALEHWGTFLAVERAGRRLVGSCGFKGPPLGDGSVEIAYFTFPRYEGRGFASAMALLLVRRALGAGEVRSVRAHTLPHPSASTRILERVGLRRSGVVLDPDDGPVWRWEIDAPDLRKLLG